MNNNAHTKVTNFTPNDDKSLIILDKTRVKGEMALKNGLGTGKNKRFILVDLANECGYDGDYFRRIVWNGIKESVANDIADFFGVNLAWLTGESPYRTFNDMMEQVKSLESKELVNTVNYINSLKGFKIELISFNRKGERCKTPFNIGDIKTEDFGNSNIKRFDEIETNDGDRIRTYFGVTYYDSIFEKDLFQYKKVSTMVHYFSKINEVVKKMFETFI